MRLWHFTMDELSKMEGSMSCTYVMSLLFVVFSAFSSLPVNAAAAAAAAKSLWLTPRTPKAAPDTARSTASVDTLSDRSSFPMQKKHSKVHDLLPAASDSAGTPRTDADVSSPLSEGGAGAEAGGAAAGGAGSPVTETEKPSCFCMEDKKTLTPWYGLGLISREDPFVTLPCRHAFHNSCITTWVTQQKKGTPGDDGRVKASCVLCRADITDFATKTLGVKFPAHGTPSGKKPSEEEDPALESTISHLIDLLLLNMFCYNIDIPLADVLPKLLELFAEEIALNSESDRDRYLMYFALYKQLEKWLATPDETLIDEIRAAVGRQVFSISKSRPRSEKMLHVIACLLVEKYDYFVSSLSEKTIDLLLLHYAQETYRAMVDYYNKYLYTPGASGRMTHPTDESNRILDHFKVNQLAKLLDKAPQGANKKAICERLYTRIQAKILAPVVEASSARSYQAGYVQKILEGLQLSINGLPTGEASSAAADDSSDGE